MHMSPNGITHVLASHSFVLQQLFVWAMFLLIAMKCLTKLAQNKHDMVPKLNAAASEKQQQCGRKQKKSKRNQRPHRHQKGALRKEVPSSGQERLLSDPDSLADIEVPALTDDDSTDGTFIRTQTPIREVSSEMVVVDCSSCVHMVSDAQHSSSDSVVMDLAVSSDIPFVADSGPTIACVGAEYVASSRSTVDGGDEGALPSDLDPMVEDAALSFIRESSCCQPNRFSPSLDDAAYSRAMLLAHRSISVRIAQGPPGLSLPRQDQDVNADYGGHDDWQAWLVTREQEQKPF